MNKRVLVIADKEDDDLLSLEKARDIALDISASIEVVKFAHYDSQSSTTITDFISAEKQRLKTVVSNIFTNTLSVTSTVIVSEDIDQWIVERCQTALPAVDLLIKSGHRTESLFHTPTDWKLIRHLHCPVLIASHEKWQSNPNILMALDLYHSDKTHAMLNKQILTWGSLWASATHNGLHAMYCIPIAKPLLELDIVDKREVETKKTPAAMDKLNSLLMKHSMHAVTCHTPAGAPDKMIPHMADELHCDLVIIGCVGREGVSGFLLGNTAERVLHHLRTDCLIITLPNESTTPT